ncbi:MAG TPA: alpha/beta fold hydrolase, partial [Amphiplicatus sp.]|nr:alpha/beta fold hydrolase [Amphiplicatus sp.]
PKTEKTQAEPILITPAWIMKYYILDLSPHNSLVSYLVSQGFTVFMISWRNPKRENSGLSFDDYRTLGVLRALDAVSDICSGRKIHAVGYCLGGTLLSIAAAALARGSDERLASLSLFAAQTDFRDPGELATFIDEDQIEWLEASMDEKGYLDAEQMLNAFQMLRSRDLIWRRFQRAYLYGEKKEEFDLLAWNADATRMPRRMHSEYLRKLFLNNDLTQGRFEVDGRPVAVSDIRAPIFALGTEKDHVAPWRSVFKIHLSADAEVTFVLTNGGHNAGVVSEPGKAYRRHHIRTKQDCEHYIAPDEWLKVSEEREGSWWPSWVEWLSARSSGKVTRPEQRRAGASGNLLEENEPLPAAPGAYVLEH